jgi:CRP-like cAMP-binding protein
MNVLFNCIDQYYKISDTSKAALNKALREEELVKNTILVSEGSICNQLFFLEKGCVRGYYNLDGKEVTYWFSFENSFLTSFYSFISRKPGIENIELLEDSILWSIRYEALQELYDQHPDIERMVRIVYERYYIQLEERLISSQFKMASERYEQLLETSPHMLQRISLGHIASYLGISQETLSRIRAKIS